MIESLMTIGNVDLIGTDMLIKNVFPFSKKKRKKEILHTVRMGCTYPDNAGKSSFFIVFGH